MAKIPLRAYLKEVENLIERGEIEQAVAHGRNILRAYPKHLETYRLLGKAYLESQRYSEAADILQRVLSVIPDDFFAQIGMSIIREDEGNMDAAIWHMERAFEVQPHNPAVQDELRRLYGRRDGIEPPKIRLTRGALVRMYARGELYPQAIAEIRAALAEDPQRLDLRVQLARLYHLSGQKNDAAEVCSELIGKLPYCYEANRLLAEILPTTSRAGETPKFQQRIYALDPYEAFISPSAPTSVQVPDQAVMVEQFLWDQAAEESAAPDWTRTVGVEWEDQKEETLPDWLNTLKAAPGAAAAAEPAHYDGEQLEGPKMDLAQPGAAAPFHVEEQPEAGSAAAYTIGEEDIIPDWMKEAGWEKSDRTADEIMAEQSIADDSGAASLIDFAPTPAEGEAVEGDIPDWLQSIAPPAAQADAVEQERSDWLEDILATPGETERPAVDDEVAAPQAVWDETTPESAFTGTVLPADEAALDLAAPESVAGEDDEVALPDWMAGFGAEIPGQEQPDAEAAVEAAREPAAEDVPDWLEQLKSGEEIPTAESLPAAELDAFEFDETVDFTAAEEVTSPVSSGVFPDWFTTTDEETATADTEAPAEQEVPVEQEAPAEQPEQAEQQAEAAPEWLAGAQALPAQEADLPDWLSGIGVEESALAEQTAPVPPAPPVDELLVTDEQAFTSVSEIAEDLPGEGDVTGLAEELAASELAASELAASEVPPTARAEGMPDLNDTDAVMAWLESLAAKQGADEATLITPLDQRSETPPDWVAQQMESSVESVEAAAAPLSEDPFAALAAESAQETAQQAVETEAELLAEEGYPAAEILPAAEVLPAAEELPAEQTPVVEPAGEATMPDLTDEAAAMAWLESLAAKQGADEATLTTTPEERRDTPPEWVMKEAEEAQLENPSIDEIPTAELHPKAAETPPEEVPAFEQVVSETAESEAPVAQIADEEITAAAETTAPDLSDMDAAMAWLESLAAKQGADEETLTTTPEQRSETPPDWVKDEIAAAESAAETGEAEASEELPEWLDSEAFGVTGERSLEGMADLAGDRSTAWMGDLQEPESLDDLRDLELLDQVPDAVIEEPDAAAAAQAPLEESPEWLRRLENDVDLPGSAANAEAFSAAEESMPWDVETTAGELQTTGLDTAAVDEAQALTAGFEETELGELPDWMKSAQEAETTGAEAAGAQAAEQVPDWLMGLEEELEADTAELSQAVPPSGGEYRAAWEPETAAEAETLFTEPLEPQPSTPQPEPAGAIQPPAWVTPSGPGAIEALRAALNRGQLDEALNGYTQLIEQEQNLDDVIRDLRDALYRYPVDIDLWQTLGDACARNNQLQDALDAYTKAEELLR